MAAAEDLPSWWTVLFEVTAELRDREQYFVSGRVLREVDSADARVVQPLQRAEQP